MGSKLEIEIVSDSGEVIGPSNRSVEDQEQERLSRIERRQQADQRARDSIALRKNTDQRATQREDDRRSDRMTRIRQRSFADEDRDWKRREAEQKRSRLERMRDARQQIVEERAHNTLRRRFINDMFGAFNHAHTGRRLNHAIDSLLSITGGTPGRGGGRAEALAAGGAAGGGRNTITNIIGGPAATTAITNILSGTSKSDLRKQIVDAELVPHKLTKPVQQQSHFPATNPMYKGAAGTIPIQSAKSTSQGLNPMYAGAAGIPNSQVSAVAGSGAEAAAAVTGLSTLGTVSVVAAAAVAALAGVAVAGTTAFIASNLAFNRFKKQLDGIPGELMFAQIEKELANFSNNLRRANEYGHDLANVERERTKLSLNTTNLFDSITAPLLPFAKEATELLNNIIKGITPIVETISALTLEPMIKLLTDILSVLNDFIIFIPTLLNQWFPALVQAALITIAQNRNKPIPEINGLDIQKELFNFLQLPVALENPKANFKFNTP